MRGEVGRAHGDAERLADPPRDAQHLALVVEVQAVAGLDLQRRRAIGEQRAARAAATARNSSSSSASRVARTVDSDAAAGAGDLLVARALQAQLEFARAIAGEHQVRVASTRPGVIQPIASITSRASVSGDARQVGARPDEGEHAVAPAERAVGDLAVACGAVERRQAGAEDAVHPEGGGVRHPPHCRGVVIGQPGARPGRQWRGMRDHPPRRKPLDPRRLAGSTSGFNVDAPGRIAAALGARPHATRAAWVVPGIANLHSHAFQRAMAGMAERRTNPADSFWTWRETMYRFAARFDARIAAGRRRAALRRDARSRLHHRLRVPLPAPRARRPPYADPRRDVARADRRGTRNRHPPDPAAGAVHDRRFRRPCADASASAASATTLDGYLRLLDTLRTER